MRKKVMLGLLFVILIILGGALPHLLKYQGPAAQNNHSSIQVEVVSAGGVLFDQMVDPSGCKNALELVTKAVGKDKVVQSKGFVSSLMGVKGIVYYTVKNGAYEAPTVSAADYPVAGLQKIVFYNYNLKPLKAKAEVVNDAIKVTVAQAKFDANFAIAGWEPLAGATVKYANQTAVTDQKGSALLSGKVKNEKIKVFTKDAAGKYTTVPEEIIIK